MHIHQLFNLLFAVSLGGFVLLLLLSAIRKGTFPFWVHTTIDTLVVLSIVMIAVSIIVTLVTKESYAEKIATGYIADQFDVEEAFVTLNEPVCVRREVITCGTWQTNFTVSGDATEGVVTYSVDSAAITQIFPPE